MSTETGEWQGLTDEEIQKRFPTGWWPRLRSRTSRHGARLAPASGISLILEGRVPLKPRIEFVKGYARSGAKGTIVVVARQGINRLLRGVNLDQIPEALLRLKQPHDSIFVLI